MIRINKTANIPNILSTAGLNETNNLIAAYNASPIKYQSRAGTPVRKIAKMSFDNAVYGDETVKTQLITEQHEKCCFCEAKFSDNSFGDVEHFRPKGAYKIRGAKKYTYPGYYWLAYDWYNLMFSCEKCNRKHKKSDFPLNNEATRKPSHAHANPLANEDCLLINPITEDPSTYISFKEEVPVPVAGSLKGSTSIKAYGLERLNNSRMEYLMLLDGLLAFYKIDTADNNQVKLAMDTFNFTRQQVLDKVRDATLFFNNAAKDTAKFSLCVRRKFPHLPIM